MKKIVIQAGHVNCQNNSIVALRNNTGAPNELSFNLDTANQVSSELRRRGFEVKQTDAPANDDSIIRSTDWDGFFSIHYDADVYGKGGYFVDFPEPSTDGATQESQRLAKVLSEEYGRVTGIVNHPERSNANTRYYYMWKYLTARTPCVLIECGVGMHVPDDWQTLHFDRPRVVEAITRGICKAFDIGYDIVPPPPPPVVPDDPPTGNGEPPPTNICIEYKDKLNIIKTILWGKGWPWTKVAKLKELLPR